MPSRHELIGTYLGPRPKCEWENDDGSVTIIASVRVNAPKELCQWCEGVGDGPCVCEQSPFDTVQDIRTIKGTIFPGDLVRGLAYRFYGVVKTHAKYGDQFCFEAYVVEQPADEQSVVAYLQQCDGIGPKVAYTLWETYRHNAVQMLREQPDVVAAAIPRLNADKAVSAASFLKSAQETERTKMDLLGLLKGRRFPKKLPDWLIRDYGSAASVVAARNPYCLMRYKGCGFLNTDKMYLDLRHNPARLKRQALCAWYAVARQQGGDTWVPFYVVRNALQQQISSANVDVERAMELACRAKMLTERFERGQRWVAEYRKARDEQMIAELLDEAREEHANNVAPLLWSTIADELEEVTDHQRDNARQATSGFIGVLAGRPGTGKTYTVARIVRVLRDRFGLDHIAIAAPTGKAAVRATAAMAAAELSVRATTLHTLLGFRGDGFAYNRAFPLPFKFIIVDESSMIDAAMARALFDARAEGAHILLVGDPNQLAPVGHGAPLRDMIFAGVPCGTLIEIQRNSGRIVRACGEIIDRGRFATSPKLDVASGENLLLIDREAPEAQIDALVSVLQRFQRDAESGSESKIDPIWDVQAIVAVNRKSPLGRKPLNKQLQELLNPCGRSVPGNPFRVGDKIINTKNGGYKSVELEDGRTTTGNGPECYVANGEQAEVLFVDANKIVARLTFPDRTILIPRSAKADTGEGEHPGTDAEGGDENGNEESTGSGCAWELGYAISCHKSQGSEWPVVITLLDDYQGAKQVESRQWLYTAISRAKRFGLLIGRTSATTEMCSRDALFQRKTFLRELIQERDEKREFVRVMDQILEGVC